MASDNDVNGLYSKVNVYLASFSRFFTARSLQFYTNLLLKVKVDDTPIAAIKNSKNLK